MYILESTDIVMAGYSNAKKLSKYISSTACIPWLAKECYNVVNVPYLVRRTKKQWVCIDLTRCAYRRKNDADLGEVRFKNDFTTVNIVFNYRTFERFINRFKRMFPNVKLCILPVNLRYWAKTRFTYVNYHKCKVVSDMQEIHLVEKKIKAILDNNENMFQISNEDIIGTTEPEFGVEFYKKVGQPDTIHFKEVYYKKLAKILYERFNI